MGVVGTLGSSAVVFPGQGSQVVGMGRELAPQNRAARQVFDHANDLLEMDLEKICFEGPAEELERTDYQQPAIFVTSVALWQTLVEAGGGLEEFSCAGGLSLGEYTALHIAGALSFEDALTLVRRRGQLMQEAALAYPGGMVSLIGGDEASARALCDDVRGGEILAPANLNCPGQLVISGDKNACGRAAVRASQFGMRAVPLPVAGAFHSPLMESAASALRHVLDATSFHAPRIPVIANVDASYHASPEAIRESLVRQMISPVRWQACVERMIADGVGRFVEIGPGRVLTGLLRKIDRRVEAINVSTGGGVAEALSAISVGDHQRLEKDHDER